MNNDEFNNFWDKYIEHFFHGLLVAAFLLLSCVNVFVTLMRGADIHKDGMYSDLIKRVDTPWPDCWYIEKYILVSTIGVILLNMAIIAFRSNMGKNSDGLTRKDRNTLKKAESKALLHDKISSLERETLETV